MAHNPLELQMQTLDYIKGKGLFPRAKRSVNENNRYLIIGYGGTGGDALYEVKKLLQDELTAAQYKSHVRMLAIDTDSRARYKTDKAKDDSGQVVYTDDERFTPSEFLWLDNVPAKSAIENGLTDGMKDWVNPGLPATIQAVPTFMDGNGASATRQVGRIMLSTDETYGDFKAKIKQLAGELTHGNDDNLMVYIITGIAGGTGSGIVIDASYLIRHAIEEMGGQLSLRTSYCGFVLLPPTGGSNKEGDIARGNRNAVAALKEIDHYMSIAKRKERYEHRFGTTWVTSDKNIFTACYLLDGTQGRVVAGKPREKAMEVIKDCILDMITSVGVVNSAAAAVQDVASFMSNVSPAARAIIGTTSEKVAPREANYIYCAIGHGQTLIPMELMKTYVAKNINDRMHVIFKKFEIVDEMDVDDFLEAVECPSDGVWKSASGLSDEEFFAAVDKAVNEAFLIDPRNSGKKGGPYYVNKLLRAVLSGLRSRKQRISELSMGTARQQRCEEIDVIAKRVSMHLKKYFEVYVAVFDEMKKYLDKSSDILCQSDRFHDFYKSNYTFTPIDFGSDDLEIRKSSGYIREYLDNQMKKVKLGEMCAGLVNEIQTHKEEWSELESGSKGLHPRFCAPDRIRSFWQGRIDKIVDATLEDYLIKYYAEDPDAKWRVDPNGDPIPETDAALKMAAKKLVAEMWGGSGAANPLAELQTGIMIADKFNGMKSFLIPQDAPHLIKYVQSEINAQVSVAMRSIQVAPSTASDRVSCYAQFSGIPAFMFSWAGRAEQNYEDAIRAAEVGLHMSETTGGALWRNFPNLLNETVWPYIKTGYSQRREAVLNRESRAMLDEATSLGLTYVTAIDGNEKVGYYTIKYLPESHMIDSFLLKSLDCEMEGTDGWQDAKKKLDEAVEKCAQNLFAKQDWERMPHIDKKEMGAVINATLPLNEYQLNFVDTVLTPLMANGDAKPEYWEEKLASALLRTTPDKSNRLRGSVLVLDRLYELVSEAQSVSARMDRFVHYVVAGLFEYVDEDGSWYYQDATGMQRQLLEIPYGDMAQETAEYYFMFEAFKKNADSLIVDMDPQYMEMMEGDNAAERKRKAIAMKEKAAPILTKVTQLMTYDRANPGRPCIATATFEKAAAKHDVEAIRSFYVDLKSALEIFNPNLI